MNEFEDGGVSGSVDGRRLTARLELAPITGADADELWRLHQDPGIVRWYGWNTNEAREFALAMERGWQDDGVGKWLARRRVDGALIGRGGCSLAMVEGCRQMEIGWAIREQYWGHGYATEIGQAGLAFAVEARHVDRVVAFTEIHNEVQVGHLADGAAHTALAHTVRASEIQLQPVRAGIFRPLDDVVPDLALRVHH